MNIKACYLCNSAVEEDEERNPIRGVDKEAGDWLFDDHISLCPECWDNHCVKNNIGTLEEALAEGITITYDPFPENQYVVWDDCDDEEGE